MLWVAAETDYRRKMAEECAAAMGCATHSNKAPWPLPNMKESSESEFWGWKCSQSFTAEAHSLSMKDENGWFDLFIFYYGHGRFIDGGFAVAVYRNDYPKPKTVKYFTWMKCDHDFVSSRSGFNCVTNYTCKHCGKGYSVDSSG